MDLNILAESLQFSHSKQVSKISEILAKNAGYPSTEVSIITQAAAFHDIGKAAIPKEILNKPAALTPEEFEIVKTHTRIGYELLFDAARVFSIAATMAREHHEHVDGTQPDCIIGRNACQPNQPSLRRRAIQEENNRNIKSA